MTLSTHSIKVKQNINSYSIAPKRFKYLKSIPKIIKAASNMNRMTFTSITGH
jgi:hypothetical protein